MVYADEKRLRQVLINLLSNAIKFTQAGSVQFVVHYRSPVAEFEVIDTGPGIQGDDLERIFAPFERGALGVSQPQTGTGLGLTISRLLAGVMGGDIKVLSTVGRGSTFKVKMLLSEVTNPQRIAPVEAPISGYHGARKTILITDDDPVHRDLLREVLTPLGFILLSAPDGPGCLALAQHCRPDLFLLDISMPGMDGWTVAETLRAERPPSGAHPDGVGQRARGPRHTAGAALPRRLSDEADRHSQASWKASASFSRSNGNTARTRSPCRYGGRRAARGRRYRHIEALIGLGQIGYVKAIQLKLDEIGSEHPEHADFVAEMRSLVDRFDLDQYMATLKTLHAYEH